MHNSKFYPLKMTKSTEKQISICQKHSKLLNFCTCCLCCTEKLSGVIKAAQFTYAELDIHNIKEDSVQQFKIEKWAGLTTHLEISLPKRQRCQLTKGSQKLNILADVPPFFYTCSGNKKKKKKEDKTWGNVQMLQRYIFYFTQKNKHTHTHTNSRAGL